MQKKLLKSLFKKLEPGNYKVIFWDGEEITGGSAPYKVRIVFNNSLPLKKIIIDPILAFGEAYIRKDIDIKGNLEEIIRMINRAGNNLIINKLFSFVKMFKNKFITRQQKMKCSIIMI